MLKKITCLFICFLYLKNSEAQHLNTTKLLDSIVKTVKHILSDKTIDSSCTKNIKQFRDDIGRALQKKKMPPDAVTAKQLLKITQGFTDTTNADEKRCMDSSVSNLLLLADQLKTELGKLYTDFVKIKLTDSSTKSGLNWTLSIDSINTTINSITIKDSLGYFKASLFPNTNYSIKANTSTSDLNDSALKIGNGETGLLTIQVQKNMDNGKTQELTPTDPLTKALDTLSKENRLLLITASVLFFLILCAGILYMRIYKNFKQALIITSNLSEELKKNQSTMEETKNNPELPGPPGQVKEAAPEPAAIEKTEAVPVTLTTDTDPGIIATSSTGIIATAATDTDINTPATGTNVDKSTTDPYFVCEIMMTAGPRKKPMSDKEGDKDLGEDVCGFISNAKEVLIWLLDGTSDDDSWRNPVNKREYFSSRLLAQSIGAKLRKCFTEKRSDSLVKSIDQAISEVKLTWLEVIAKLPNEERLYLKNKIENKNFPQCSTTVLIGHLEKNGDFNAYRAGDSKMFLFSTSSQNEMTLVQTPLMEKNVERIFFRLQLNANQKFEIVSNEAKAKYEAIEKKNIHTIISFSDGIGMDTELLLKEEYKNNPDRTKNEIIYHLQGTGDDKSICFIERKEMKA